MIVRQFIELPRWNWKVQVFYESTPECADRILKIMFRLGCTHDILAKAQRNLFDSRYNTGLTFSSRLHRQSVMVINHSTSRAQFWNSLDHEKGHLAEHIARACNIDREGEEFEYLKGEIAQKMAPVAIRYLCGCRVSKYNS